MSHSIAGPTLTLLRREAAIAAARLVRRFRLPSQDRDDLRQDLLVDLFARLKDFDPHRGTVTAFAMIVIKNGVARIAIRVRRGREMRAAVSLDDPLPGTAGTTVGGTYAESSGYLAMMGQRISDFADTDRRLDLGRVLGTLRAEDLALCALLIDRTPTELGLDGVGSRAGLYRQVREIRLRLMAGGLSATS